MNILKKTTATGFRVHQNLHPLYTKFLLWSKLSYNVPFFFESKAHWIEPWMSQKVTNSEFRQNYNFENICNWRLRMSLSIRSVQFSSLVQLCPTLCNPMDCSTPGFLSSTVSQSLLKLMSLELLMPSNHLILCHLLLLLPSIFRSIRVFSNESALRIRWLKYWNLSFSIS